jgi:spermidine synthase
MFKKPGLIIALTSSSLVGLELVWTRLFSAEIFYAFSFLVLSLAILGGSLGALSLRLFDSDRPGKLLAPALLLSAVSCLSGPLLLFKLSIDFSLLFSDALIWLKLASILCVLGGGYFFGGFALAMIFRQRNQLLPRLYMLDLLGAASGVLLSIILMNTVQVPAAAFLMTVPLLIAGVLATTGMKRVLPLLIFVLCIFLSQNADTLLASSHKSRGQILNVHWDASAKTCLEEMSPEYRNFNIDNVANSPSLSFDGNWERADSLLFQFSLPVDYLISLFEDCVFLSLGAGGGQDVLQALQEGATEIHAVEVNARMNALMRNGEHADYSGRIYDDQRVSVITDDARVYVRRFENKFDLIYSASSNTWAAMASGSFALAENYLFTTEALRDYWNALSDDGFLVIEHQFYGKRLFAEALEVLKMNGIENAEEHLAFYSLPQRRRQVLLLSKRALTEEIRYHAFIDLEPQYHDYIHLLFPAADSLKLNPVNQIAENGWRLMADSNKTNISPCVDNRPFIAQLGLWRNLNSQRLKQLPYYAEFLGFPLASLMIAIILASAFLIVIPLNLLPLVKRRKQKERMSFPAWLYFFAIGMAFMMIEVVLIRQFALFIGSTIYSIALVLFVLLTGAGTGSYFSRRFSAGFIFSMIAVWLLFDCLFIESLFALLTNYSLGGRVFISGLVLFPISFLLGMPFPKAGLRVGNWIDWGFAVNGAAAVVGSTLVTLVSIEAGFRFSLILALLIYLTAWILYHNSGSWIIVSHSKSPD